MYGIRLAMQRYRHNPVDRSVQYTNSALKSVDKVQGTSKMFSEHTPLVPSSSRDRSTGATQYTPSSQVGKNGYSVPSRAGWILGIDSFGSFWQLLRVASQKISNIISELCTNFLSSILNNFFAEVASKSLGHNRKSAVEPLHGPCKKSVIISLIRSEHFPPNTPVRGLNTVLAETNTNTS